MLRKIQKKEILKLFEIENVPFKILVLDSHTKDILAPLFKLSEFRDAGICAHFLITNAKTAINELPAIYYVSDFSALTPDILKLLYSNYYIYSSSQIKRNELENLAVKLSETQQAKRIKCIGDTFTDFISLQSNLFTLNLKDSYIKDYSREIVTGLFSVFATVKSHPLIIGNLHTTGIKNNILKLLENKIRQTKILKNDAVKRPLLILVDRDIDLVTPLMHSLGFLEIIDDLFDLELNKVNLGDSTMNIDTDSEFFENQWFNEFVEVVELINTEVLTFKKEMAIKNLNASDITKMLEVAPELQKKNEVVTNLMNISLKAVQEIKKRHLDEFYSMEHNFNKDDLMDLSEKGNDEDIIRLCISLMGSKNANFIRPLLEKRNIQTKVIEYMKKFFTEENSYGSFLTNKVKNLFFSKTNPMVTYVESILLKIKSNSLSEYFETSSNESNILLSEISEIFVFCNGGVTYTELSKIREIEEKYKIPVVLGGTEIINAKKLISQIERLE